MSRKALSKKNLWDAAPKPLKAVFGWVARIVPPATFLGSRFREQMQFLARAERWSVDECRAYQLDQLKRVLSLAYSRSAFYRKAFESIGFESGDFRELEDLAALPLIDKQTVLENLHEMCVRSPSMSDVDYVSTGGSQGQPMHFYIGANRSAIEYAHLISSWQRIGYRLGDPMSVFRGRIIKSRHDELPYEYDPLLRHHHFSTFDMTDENMLACVERLRQIGPCYLHVYPSAVATLARFVRRAAISPPPVRGVIAESENVYPDQRELVEDVFGCRFFSCYGHSEKLVCAAECEQSSHYHVWTTYGYCELLDEDGNAVTTPGVRGEIVGTGFINDVMPFIRYRTGDYAIYVAESCSSCGRNQLVLADIRGHRTQEMLVLNDGSCVSWTAINLHDDTFANVRQVQFHQDAPGVATLRLVPVCDLSNADREKIIRGLQRRLQNKLNIKLEIRESIPLTSRGKSVYVDQRLPIQSTAGQSESFLECGVAKS